jgi:hypothetical protein
MCHIPQPDTYFVATRCVVRIRKFNGISVMYATKDIIFLCSICSSFRLCTRSNVLKIKVLLYKFQEQNIPNSLSKVNDYNNKIMTNNAVVGVFVRNVTFTFWSNNMHWNVRFLRKNLTISSTARNTIQ